MKRPFLTFAFVFALTGAYAESTKKSCCPPPDACCPSRFEQGLGLCETYPPAYNAPARIDVICKRDVDVFASFIYWHVSQEGMDLSPITNAASFNSTGIQYQPFDYKPGFKVGMGSGFKHDDWVWFAEYTRIHQKTSLSTTLSSGFFWSGSSFFAPQFDPEFQPQILTSQWKLHFDRVDLDISRPYYQGTQLTISPYGGVQGLLITQTLAAATDPGAAATATVNANSHCWAVGPNVGVKSAWLMGRGFRFEGMAGGSLLFTRYTKTAIHQFVSAAATDDDDAQDVNAVVRDYDALRPTLDLGLGIGWGHYWKGGRFFTDISARYDFLQLWGQNMMRHAANQFYGASFAAEDLQMHGLTANFRFDF